MKQERTVGKSATFHYLPTDKFTTDYFSVHFILPLCKETVSGYTLLTKLFKNGCRAYPSQEALAKRWEELYATGVSTSVSKQGERQMISFGLDILAECFAFDGNPPADDAFALLTDVLTVPCLDAGVFPSETVAREKAALKAQCCAAINDKKKYAVQRCREIMCENEAYSLALEGTEETIDACTPASLYALYQHMLKEAELEIFYIGREAENTVYDRVLKLVSKLGERSPISTKTVIKSTADTPKRVTESVDAVQGKLAIGFRTGITESTSQKEKDALVLFNIIYGSSPISKLFVNVREKLSLCYYCASRNDNQKGVLFVHSGVENENAVKAEEEIMLQLSEIQKGNITDNEIFCAKQAFRDLTRSVYDSPFSIEQWYLTRLLQGDKRSPDEMEAAIDALTAVDVANAASRITVDTIFFLEGNTKKEGEEDV